MRDLRPGGRDEVLEHPRGCVLSGTVEAGDRAIEVLAHDRSSAPELDERRGAQDGRAPVALLVPEPLHDELQVRRLDAIRLACGSRLREDRLDERGFGPN